MIDREALFKAITAYLSADSGHDASLDAAVAEYLTSAGEGAVPVGWQLVPKEPTFPMCNAAIDVDAFKLGDISPLGFRMSPQRLFEKCYAAMLAAAPHPTRQDGAREGERELPEKIEQALNAYGEAVEDTMTAVLARDTDFRTSLATSSAKRQALINAILESLAYTTPPAPDEAVEGGV